MIRAVFNGGSIVNALDVSLVGTSVPSGDPSKDAADLNGYVTRSVRMHRTLQ